MTKAWTWVCRHNSLRQLFVWRIRRRWKKQDFVTDEMWWVIDSLLSSKTPRSRTRYIWWFDDAVFVDFYCEIWLVVFRRVRKPYEFSFAGVQFELHIMYLFHWPHYPWNCFELNELSDVQFHPSYLDVATYLHNIFGNIFRDNNFCYSIKCIVAQTETEYTN